MAQTTIKTYYGTEECHQMSTQFIKNDKIIRIEGSNAYSLCVNCHKEFHQVNQYSPYCFDCKRLLDLPSPYSLHYNQLKQKGLDYWKIYHIREALLSNHHIFSTFNIYVYNPTTKPYESPILYYHKYCGHCGHEITREDFFHEITDYCCTIFSLCKNCHHYLSEVD